MKDIQLSGESWQGAAEEHSVEASGQIVLECSGCGEHLTLLGLEEDWPKEHRDAFGCSGCGNTVTLGTFIATFLYSLMVLRTIRGGEEDFVPQYSVIVAMLLAVCSIGVLIYFMVYKWFPPASLALGQ